MKGRRKGGGEAKGKIAKKRGIKDRKGEWREKGEEGKGRGR